MSRLVPVWRRGATLPLLALLVALAPAPLSGQRDADAAERASHAAEMELLLERANLSRVKGAADAPVTIVEISDFQCPFCAVFARETLPALDSAYIATGRARLVYVNFPMPSHREAWPAAEAALCAGAQGAFWPMHDRIFAEQRRWSGAPDAGTLLRDLAGGLGLDLDAFDRCVGEDRVATLILDDVMQAAGAGARATPTLILNGVRVLPGAVPFDQLSAVIEELLAEP
jgi:protein-disulfide isomerase